MTDTTLSARLRDISKWMEQHKLVACVPSDWEPIREAADRLEAAEAALRSLSAFAKDAVSEFWARDSADMQEYGIKHGLLVEVAYDPEKHGDVEDSEKGDLIYVYSDWFKDVSRALPDPEGG